MRDNDEFFDLMWNADIQKISKAEEVEYIEVPERSSNSLVLFNFRRSNQTEQKKKSPAA